MHDDDDTTDANANAEEPRARDVVRSKQTLPRRVAGDGVVERLAQREARRPAGNGSRTWKRVAGEDPFVIARLEGDVVRATTYVDGRFVRIDQEAREAARARHGGVPTPPSSWGGGASNAEAALPPSLRNIPVAPRGDGERAPNQGESLIPAGFRDLPIAKPKDHAPSAAEVAAKRRAAEAANATVPTTAPPAAPTPQATRPAHSSTGRAMLNPRARTPVGPTVRPNPAPPVAAALPQPAAPTRAVPAPAGPASAPPAVAQPASPSVPEPPTPVAPPRAPAPHPDAAAHQAQRPGGGSLDDLFQRPAGGTEGRARLGRRGPPPTESGGKPPG